MRIVSSKTFRASPENLWQIVHDPANMPAWNEKCVECSSNGIGEGSRFNAVFEMSGKRSDAQGEVIEYVLHKRIRYRYRYVDDSKAGSVEETYDISKVGRDRSKVEHEVNLKHAALPFWVKLLAFVLEKFGKKMGKGPLDGIEELLNA